MKIFCGEYHVIFKLRMIIMEYDLVSKLLYASLNFAKLNIFQKSYISYQHIPLIIYKFLNFYL